MKLNRSVKKTHKGQIEHAGIEQRPGDTLGLHKSFTGHGDLNDGDIRAREVSFTSVMISLDMGG